MQRALMFIIGLVFGFLIGKNVDFGGSVDLSKVGDRGQYAAIYEAFELLSNQGVVIRKEVISKAAEDIKEKSPSLNPEDIRLAKAALFSEAQRNGDKIAAQALVEARDFLSTQKSKSGIKTMPSGLLIEVLKEGNGPAPVKSDWVALSYEGRLQDGKIFETSNASGGSVQVPISNLLPGMQEALTQMKTGAQWRVTIPPELGYGARVRPGLPPNSVLVFDLTLHSVIKR